VTDRNQLLHHFVQQHFPNHLGELAMVSGDASFRRYYRIRVAAHTFILMDAPKPMEDVEKFYRVATALAQAGVRVPQMIAADFPQGFLAIEDLGDVMLSLRLTDDPTPWYQQALSLLPKLRQLHQFTELPLFDSAFIQRELGIFTEWFIQRHLGMTLNQAELAMLASTFAQLELAILQQPQAAMHRDFHSRNLMVLPDTSLAVIDFQDAVLGPVCYDAVSLVRDCYVRWPDAQVARWRGLFLSQLQQQGWYLGDEAARFEQDFDFTGLQRHIKVLGIFCRLNYRDQKAGYMADLPRVFSYVMDVAAQYPQLSEFVAWLQRDVQPRFLRSLG